ncbi:hypothetical protein [Lacticaseibacillus pantheris]|uniref:hypothetical protein n=1 Tax=Lacticaseibacillus pantheris TaxID=171523 RepID=UPI0006D0BF98|nr:hypothetical protein [Lacticaseibacillus pantheris]
MTAASYAATSLTSVVQAYSLATVTSQAAASAASYSAQTVSAASLAAQYNASMANTPQSGSKNASATLAANSDAITLGSSATLTMSTSNGFVFKNDEAYTIYESTDGTNWNTVGSASSFTFTPSYSGNYYFQGYYTLSGGFGQSGRAATNIITIVVNNTNGSYPSQASSSATVAPVQLRTPQLLRQRQLAQSTI